MVVVDDISIIKWKKIKLLNATENFSTQWKKTNIFVSKWKWSSTSTSTLQDTSKLQYVEDFLEGMLGKQNFEITYIHLRINIFFFFYKIKTT